MEMVSVLFSYIFQQVKEMLSSIKFFDYMLEVIKDPHVILVGLIIVAIIVFVIILYDYIVG